jgi:REP-associated tyrosine transposase
MGKSFAWQRSYGAFGVCKSTLDSVVRYIRNQEAHHRRRSYEQEFIALLEKQGVPYDPADIFR